MLSARRMKYLYENTKNGGNKLKITTKFHKSQDVKIYLKLLIFRSFSLHCQNCSQNTSSE